jgi:hypothetical protein
MQPSKKDHRAWYHQLQLVVLFAVVLSGCTNDEAIIMKPFFFILIIIAATAISRKKNNLIVEKNKEMEEAIKNNAVNNLNEEYHESDIQNSYQQIRKDTTTPVGTYKYKQKTIIVLFFIQLLVLLYITYMIYLFEVHVIFLILLLGFTAYVSYKMIKLMRKENRKHVYYLFSDRIECYDPNGLLFNIKFKDISDIKVDYRTHQSKYGEQILAEYFLIRTNNSTNVYKIEATAFFDQQTKRSLKADFQELFLGN